MNFTTKQRIADIQRGNVPAGYRKTNSGVMPIDWKVKILGSIFTARDERVDNTADTPLFSLTIEDGITEKTERYEREFLVKKEKNYKKVYPGDFVYNPMNLRFGAIARYHGNTPCSVSGYYDVFYLKNPSLYGDFIETLLQSDILLKEYANAATGSLIEKQRVHFSNFCKIGFMQPNELEITKIAKILGCCDRVIALKKELIAEKKKQKKALMQKLLNPDRGFRLPGFSGEWKKTTIGESGTFVKGKGIQNSQCTSMGFPCVKYGDIYMKYNVSFNVAQSFTSESVFSESLQITSGALLFTCSGEDPLEIGKCVLYSGSDCIAVGGDIIVMYPNASISPDFLVHQQYSDDLIKQKSTLGKGNSIVHIHLPEIKSLKISLPPTIEEQKAIADILSTADKEIDLLEQELAQQEQKKKSLMQLLLTGTVRV